MNAPVYVNLKAARDQLSQLIGRALAGEDIVITRDGEPVVHLVPAGAKNAPRIPGSHPQFAVLADAILEPLPQEELDAWEGR